MPFREVDVFSRLMADRIIFLGTGIDDYIANIIQAQPVPRVGRRLEGHPDLRPTSRW